MQILYNCKIFTKWNVMKAHRNYSLHNKQHKYLETTQEINNRSAVFVV